jgi:4'-phosphopantetheinyl transferase EntD
MTDQNPSPSSSSSDRAWQRAFQLALPHGIVVGIHLPASPEPPPEAVLQRLHPRERAHAAELQGARKVQWIGGRLALQLALKRLRSRRLPFTALESGGVQAPQGLTASVSHKRDIAVGMVGQATAGNIGVDIETLEPSREHLAPRLLTEAELERWGALPEPRRWPSLLLSFSIKESIYKAIHPHVERYVGFHEAELELGPNGGAGVTMHLAQGEGPFEVQAHYHWLEHHLLTSARVRPLDAPSG